MAVPMSGKTGSFTANGAQCCLRQWDFDVQGTDDETASFCNNGFETGIVSFIVAVWSVEGDWDSTLDFMGGPPGLYPRDDAQLGFGLPVGSKLLPRARVLSSKLTCPAKGIVAFNASGKSNGQFQW